MTQTVAVQVNELSRHFGKIKAVDQISFTVYKGDVFGFLGQNGAGKTTTIGMLLGLITPTSGGGNVLGFNIETEQSLIKPKVGAIIENPCFYPYLTAFDNLKAMYYASNLKPDKDRIKDILNQVGLGERANTKYKTYSLGMKQRLGLASVLLTDPEIIFLDEPTNGLDPAGQKEIRELIIRLAKEQNKTVFISSHQLSEIEKICNRVAIVQKGKIIEIGATEELLRSNEGIYFQIGNPELGRQILNANGFKADHSVERNFNLFVHADTGKNNDIIRLLLDASIDITAIEPHKHSLEDYFLQLTSDKA